MNGVTNGLGFVEYLLLCRREKRGFGLEQSEANFELVTSGGGSSYFPQDSAFYVFAAGCHRATSFYQNKIILIKIVIF